MAIPAAMATPAPAGKPSSATVLAAAAQFPGRTNLALVPLVSPQPIQHLPAPVPAAIIPSVSLAPIIVQAGIIAAAAPTEHAIHPIWASPAMTAMLAPPARWFNGTEVVAAALLQFVTITIVALAIPVIQQAVVRILPFPERTCLVSVLPVQT